MAFAISGAQIEALRHNIQNANQRAYRAIEKIHEHEVMNLAEAIGGAALIGFVRGKMEEADGSWNIPGTTLDIEMIAGAALAGLGAYGSLVKGANVLGKYNSDAMFLGGGILAHYAGQVMRKYGKSGAFSMVAGSPELIGTSPMSLIGNNALRSALAGR